MADSFIIANNLVKVFKSKAEELTVLRGLNFKINEGEIICLLGTSGSGKTTTLNILAGLDKPTSGEVLFNNENINEWSNDIMSEYRLKDIGFIYQEFYLLEHLTALENVMVPIILIGKTQDEAKKIALNLLQQVGLGKKTMNHPEELSSGEKQRVCVARAIANSPSLLIADEPTGTLDTKTGDKIMELLLTLIKKNNMVMIYTTHDPYLSSFASRLFVLKNGLIEEFEPSSVEGAGFNNISFETKEVS